MHVNAGDTAWMLTSTALVFFMMPGLALFCGGLVRFRGYLVFIGLWPLIVYSPFAHAERSEQADMTGQRPRRGSVSSSGEWHLGRAARADPRGVAVLGHPLRCPSSRPGGFAPPVGAPGGVSARTRGMR